MRQGRFEQIASAEEIYSRPVSRFVANFMGEVNLFEVTADDEAGVSWREADVEAVAGALSLAKGWRGTLMVRPELIRFLGPQETADFRVKGTLVAEYALGSRVQYSVEAAGGMQLTVERPFETRHEDSVGTPVILGWDRDAIHPIAETNSQEAGHGKA
jgi:spermidine/putrescine transport system ATP-binding protein